jgi:hypothetical protein
MNGKVTIKLFANGQMEHARNLHATLSLQKTGFMSKTADKMYVASEIECDGIALKKYFKYAN